MNRGDRIAAKVSAGLVRAATATGEGRFYGTLKRKASGESNPWDAEANGTGEPTLHEISGLQTKKQIRDRDGTLIGKTMTVLLVDPTDDVVPLKSDVVVVGVRKQDVDADTVFHEISDVDTVAPAGTALLHKIKLAD
ncbi:hypothetical protein A8B82_15285 [Sulfitobacter sp. EhC04]|uniref:hypothetical protein n=1 Tax=Sulfitobacter sp. EhC04 TaxID=1849168 RepID=UPI0007F3EB84|nr:hypothetical protein [Sulfitobacter sp. EhC04]OAN76753.1 hypothetical protein A8B82_15285 [Sulfitobacter sp. EhC04]